MSMSDVVKFSFLVNKSQFLNEAFLNGDRREIASLASALTRNEGRRSYRRYQHSPDYSEGSHTPSKVITGYVAKEGRNSYRGPFHSKHMNRRSMHVKKISSELKNTNFMNQSSSRMDTSQNSRDLYYNHHGSNQYSASNSDFKNHLRTNSQGSSSQGRSSRNNFKLIGLNKINRLEMEGNISRDKLNHLKRRRDEYKAGLSEAATHSQKHRFEQETSLESRSRIRKDYEGYHERGVVVKIPPLNGVQSADRAHLINSTTEKEEPHTGRFLVGEEMTKTADSSKPEKTLKSSQSTKKYNTVQSKVSYSWNQKKPKSSPSPPKKSPSNTLNLQKKGPVSKKVPANKKQVQKKLPSNSGPDPFEKLSIIDKGSHIMYLNSLAKQNG